MKIQKFKGRNEQEVIQKVKDELGSAAIILNVRTIKSKWYIQPFIKNTVEVTAATEHEATTDELPLANNSFNLDELTEKMNNMERLLASTTDKMVSLYKENQVIPEEEPETNKMKIERLIYTHLVKQEVEEEVARSLLRGTDDLGEDPDIEDVIRIVYNNIANIIGEPSIIEEVVDNSGGPQVIFFIGPTGVGKTTSIAKLTADFSLKKQKKVGLITADTYRIAAIDQLRTYAEILSVPLQVVYSAEELQKNIGDFDNTDYVLVDTAGRSHKNDEHLDELQQMLDMFPQKKIYLVLSATTKFTDLISIAKRYTKLCDEFAIIITKTDETASAGTILNLKYYTGRSLSYVSFGQNVPDDIEIIDGAKYAKQLLGSLRDE